MMLQQVLESASRARSQVARWPRWKQELSRSVLEEERNEEKGHYMSGKKSRTKGHSWERQVANMLKPLFPAARRGYQTRGGSAEDPDVKGTPFAIEAKHHKSQPSIPAALRQADEAEKGISVAVTKKTYNKPIASMYLTDWLELVKMAYSND